MLWNFILAEINKKLTTFIFHADVSMEIEAFIEEHISLMPTKTSVINV